MNKLILTNAVVTSLSSRKNIDGQEHLVVPVVALKEGILNDIFYSKEEIQTFAEAWNGVPVPVDHPKTDGIYVSANSPKFEDTTNIGKFFNANYSDGKLKGELWINIDKAERLGFSDIIKHFDSGKMMEVSTGLFSDTDQQTGIHNNSTYTFTAKNIRPDHIALLPNEIGACSIEDGCGAMRANKKEHHCPSCGNKVKMNQNKIVSAMKLLGKRFGFTTNEISHDDIRSKISDKLDLENKHKDEKIYSWVMEVFSNNFIYMFEDKIYKRSYTEEDGEISLSNDKIEVIRKTTYESVTGVIGNDAVNSTMEVDTMKDKDKDKEKLVAAIIANEDINFGDDDKEILMSLDDVVLAKMQPIVNKVKDDENVIDNPIITSNSLSDEDIQLFKQLKANENDRVNAIRANVVASYEHLSEEVVANMDLLALDALEKGIKPNADYSARGGVGGKPNADKVRTHRSVLLTNKEDKEANNGKD